MRLLIYGLYGALVFTVGCQSLEKRSSTIAKLDYRIDYIAGELKVWLSFIGQPDGTTPIKLPTDIFAGKKVYPGFSGIELQSKGASLQATKDPLVKTISHRASQPIRLSYSIKKAEGQEKINLGQAYFYLTGSLLAHPVTGEQDLELNITWNLPKNWKGVSSYGPIQNQQQFRGNFGEIAIENIKYAGFAAGDFRIHNFNIKDHPFIIATRGKWAFHEKSFFTKINKIVTNHRSFWKDFSTPYYFMLLIPLEGPCCGLGGHGITNGFVAFASEGQKDTSHLEYVLTHEHLHHWIGEKMAAANADDVFWFTEGFTDYYARKLSHKDLMSYVTGFNGVLRKYFKNKDREAPNSFITKEFFSSRSARDLAYHRSQIVAMNLDHHKGKKNTLDPFMRKLFRVTQKENKKLTNDLIFNVLKDFFDKATFEKYRAIIMEGGIVRPNPDVFGPCVKLKDKKLPQYQVDKTCSF